MLDRRRFLQALAALGVAGTAAGAHAQLNVRPRFAASPFTLGVASGYPQPGRVVLWTRLAPEPLAPDGGMAPETIPVRWEIARDDGFKDIVASGAAYATPEWAHSVHVEAAGLQAGRDYRYRFVAGDAASPIGRTRTAPRVAKRLRFAFASCQHYEQGFFAAYRHMLADDPELVLHLGDYIYESTWGHGLVRSHGDGEAVTLEDYRRRYALYKTDPDLQAAHAACPWVVTWDDHEVENDYAGAQSQHLDSPEWFLARRAAAYKAWYEHQPVPRAMVPFGPDARIHTRLGYGNLAAFFVLDDRQHRSAQACPRPGRGGSNRVDARECAELADPARTLLGQAQERWLAAGLGASRARWTFIAQQTRMAPWRENAGGEPRTWTDAWDGYPAARRRLLESLQGKDNAVVIGGDIHAFNVNQLKLDFDDAKAPVIASEFVGTSITAQGPAQKRLDAFRAANPHVLLADSRSHGYVRAELTPELLKIDLRAMEHVRTREAKCNTLASFVVEDGHPGPQRFSS